MVTSTVEKLSPTRVKLHISVTPDELKPSIAHAYEHIAQDIVAHFPARGYLGKGMVIAVDKFTAVKMYDKVQQRKKEERKRRLDPAGYMEREYRKAHPEIREREKRMKELRGR